MTLEDVNDTKLSLERAEKVDPQSSEVNSYRGQLEFEQGQMEEAPVAFHRAIACDGGNPTPYVNTALAVTNTPTPRGPPGVSEAIRLPEKAIEVDSQFQTAYIHFGQLSLSMATDLSTAQEVIALYYKGL